MTNTVMCLFGKTKHCFRKNETDDSKLHIFTHRQTSFWNGQLTLQQTKTEFQRLSTWSKEANSQLTNHQWH